MDVRRYPRGLLDLLGAKGAGVGLPQAADFLQPSLELLPFFGAVSRGLQVGSGLLINGINTTFIQVPANEVWLMRHVSVGITTGGASGVTNFNIWMIVPEDAGGGLAITPPGPTLAASANVQWPHSFPEPLLVNPGTIFTILTNGLTGSVTGTLALLFDRLKC